jgi:metal-responsive CopG/Arc/MetJ family transcriptional regulator
MEYTNIEELLNNDKLRVNVDLPRRHLDMLDEYVKINQLSTRKKLLEMIIIKFALEHQKK